MELLIWIVVGGTILYFIERAIERNRPTEEQTKMMVNSLLDIVISEIAKSFYLQEEVEEHEKVIRNDTRESVLKDLKKLKKKKFNLVRDMTAAYAASVIIVQCYGLDELDWDGLFFNKQELYQYLAYQSPHAINGKIFKYLKEDPDEEDVAGALQFMIKSTFRYGNGYLKYLTDWMVMQWEEEEEE